MTVRFPRSQNYFSKNFFSPNLSDLIIPACKRDCARTVELVCLPKRLKLYFSTSTLIDRSITDFDQFSFDFDFPAANVVKVVSFESDW